MPKHFNEISNSDDMIDSRDIEARIEELLNMDHDDDEAAELKALQELAQEAVGYSSDWHYGVTLIRDSYFTDYVQELLEDCGDIPQSLPSYVVIDWEATADNIKLDYSSVDFDGVTYWIR
jgi:hypothetical protein